jgi:hypothetical protein
MATSPVDHPALRAPSADDQHFEVEEKVTACELVGAERESREQQQQQQRAKKKARLARSDDGAEYDAAADEAGAPPANREDLESQNMAGGAPAWFSPQCRRRCNP